MGVYPAFLGVRKALRQHEEEGEGKGLADLRYS